jgi:signal transduction histidine kinase/DNA-binding LacI/PurR family transcriptional regulator
MSPRGNSESQRKTIGVFTARVGRVWGLEFLDGILDAAAARDTNVVVFVGGKPTGTIFPGQLKPSYGIYDLAKPDHLAGLVLSADIGHNLEPSAIKRFCDNYSTPIIVNSLGVAGIPNILADNTGGMRQLLRHLIKDHGYQRIAFLRGLKGQLEAEQRFQAYKEELKENGIRFDEKLVLQGDLTPESGRAAVQALFDDRKVTVDAIVSANDRMAFGVLEALQSRGIQVPGDVALAGFDDLNESQSLGVPLTTVRQSFYSFGKQAVDSLLHMVAGEKVSPQIVVPTSLVVRWSCGCLPESVRKAAVQPAKVAQTGHLENKREAAVNAMMMAAGVRISDGHTRELTNVFTETWDAFLSNLRAESDGDAFLKAIEVMIRLLERYEKDTSTWHDVISTLRNHALAAINDQKVALRAENMFQQARMLAGELSQRMQAYRRLQLEQQEEVLQDFSFSMAPAMSLKEIADAMEKNFPAMGVQRCYVMMYSDVPHPHSATISPAENYRLFLSYDEQGLKTPPDRPHLMPGHLNPEGKTPTNRRYAAIVMPLTIAETRFGFLWIEMGPRDWEVYVRVRNLLSSALLRTVLVEQRQVANDEVERLLVEARKQAGELASAKELAEDAAEKSRRAALENAHLYQAEAERRRAAESLVKAGRQLSSLLTIHEVPQQILEQLRQLFPYERGSLLLEDSGGTRMVAHIGFPDDKRVDELWVETREGDVYDQIVQSAEPIIIDDVTLNASWKQVEWLPVNKSWIGVPLFTKNHVIGMLSLTRTEAGAFDQDDILLVSTFAMQAAVALENARLYDEITRFSELLERMVSQRTEELNDAYRTLEKLDKNKTAFINVAAHELRTPITVMKGYLGMLRGNPNIHTDELLTQAVDGVLKGTDRLHLIVNSMLDVARIDSQVLKPHFEPVEVLNVVKFVQAEYRKDLEERHITLQVEGVNALPNLMADQQLLQKALDNVVVNAIKFTPDNGVVTIFGQQVTDERMGPCIELQVRDTGIGIDPANHKIIFEKLYQIGKVELHSSGRTKFKGGGPGLGLAIAAGIIKAHQGKIWVESAGQDEEKLLGSTFFIRIPQSKAA